MQSNNPPKNQPTQRSQGIITRLFLAAVIIGLFALVVVLNGRSKNVQHGEAMVPKIAPQEALARYGFYLTESAEKSGIHFVHQAPHLDPKLAHIIGRVADMGAGVAVGDFDHDGYPDFYVTNSGENSKNALYHNNHNGTFTDVAEQMGVADVNQDGTGVSMGAVWGDFDNDGYEDLLVYKWGRPRLFHNNKGKGFTDVTEKSGLPKWMNANTALWLDYDGDGKLDLLLCGYFDESMDLWHLKDTKVMPDSLEYARNGTRKYLLRGHGDGTFEDVTDKVGLNTKKWTLAAGAVDLRGTGYPDIVLANDYGTAEMWQSGKGNKFTDFSRESEIGKAPKSGMNVAFGDILNQGKYAIYISNISEDVTLLQGNNLWVPRAGSSKDKLRYDNLAHDMGVELGGWSFGAQFGDLNNDGNLDLYLTDGYLTGKRSESYAYDYSHVAGGNESIIRDAANWPPLNDRTLYGKEQKRLWLNDGAGHFDDVAQAVGATDVYDGRSVALIDIQKNGSLSVLSANQRGPLLLYVNTVAPENHWVGFDLEGTKTNRSAIGTQVTVYWNHQKQIQYVSGGIGFCAQNQRPLHFGLGKSAAIEKVEIRWQSGAVQTLTNVKLDTYNKIKEPN